MAVILLIHDSELLDIIQFESIEEQLEEGEIYDCTLTDGQNIEQVDVVVNQEYNVDLDDTSGSLVGMMKGIIDEMHKLYCKHACEIEFSVRKGTSKFSTDETHIVLGKLFIYACAGIRVSTKENCSKQKRNVALTRTNCKTVMRIKRNNDGVYEVVKHIEKHNHPLTRIEWSHLHRSERNITEEKTKAIEEMLSSGMRAT
ncbi:hypothetical protein ACS0TY_026083 [Phlomoides rotata]